MYHSDLCTKILALDYGLNPEGLNTMQIKDSWKKQLSDENTLKFESWDEVLKFIKDNKHEIQGCIFRGQKDSSWKLEPSFFRKKPLTYEWEKLQHLAFVHLENFKKFTRGRHRISYTDPNDCDENWWALGQHYGLATPLLDWVRTPYVAAFFAFIEEIQKNDESTRAIFILDIEKIRHILNDYRGDPPITYRLNIIDPLTHENKRVVSQQGIFTYINHYGYRTIESYLDEINDKCSEKINGEILLLKLIIPSNERLLILEQLDLMNINHSTLFPDLPGSSAHCNYLLNKDY